MTRLQALLDDLLAEGVRNPCVRVESHSGEIVFEGAAGQARADEPSPTTAATPIHLASVTKTYTAVLILQLVEEGSAGPSGLDAALGELDALPRLVVERISRRSDVGFGPQITLRQLLRHTAGLRDAFEDDAMTLGSAPGSLGAALMRSENLLRRRWVPWAGDRPEEAEAGVLNWYLARKLGDAPVGEPGERFHYSDTGYVLLGLIAEALSGRPFHRLLRERIIEPLGLSRTYLAYRDDPPDLGPTRSPEADVWASGRPLLSTGANLAFDWAGGGLVSTAADMIVFFRALLDGRLFQGPVSLREMTTFVSPPGLPPPKRAIGLGLDLVRYGEMDLIGRTGAWGARIAIEPRSGLILAGSTNHAEGPPDWHVRFLRAIVAS
jgi:D-alanyl-D-alanine carboxypeptidase